MSVPILCVDFQEDFSNSKGKCYGGGESIDFVKSEFVPFLEKNSLKVHEIVSDYRFTENKFPRPGDTRNICNIDDSFGFSSEIPDNVKHSDIWVKCMNSPIWVRENCGIKGKLPGPPFQYPKSFSSWLERTIGLPESVDYVLVFGLTTDCCVLCTVQELYFRGYKIKVLFEATDPRGKSPEEIKRNKIRMTEFSSLNIWAEFVYWEEEKKRILDRISSKN